MIFARMVIMWRDKIGNSKQFFVLHFLSDYVLRAMKNQDEVELLFLFNCSRGLIDNKDSITKLFDYLTKYDSITSFTLATLSSEEKLIIQDGFNFFKSSLKRGGVKNALAIFNDHQMIPEYGYLKNITVDDCRQALENMKIEIVSPDHLFNGMIGRGSKIYFNLSKMFSGCDTPEKKKAIVVEELYQEGAHELIRIFGEKKYASYTHIGKNLTYKEMEAGYLLEKLVFGPFKKKYWISDNHAKILEILNYDQLPIFNSGEALKMIDEKIAEFCSGICSFESPTEYFVFQ